MEKHFDRYDMMLWKCNDGEWHKPIRCSRSTAADSRKFKINGRKLFLIFESCDKSGESIQVSMISRARHDVNLTDGCRCRNVKHIS